VRSAPSAGARNFLENVLNYSTIAADEKDATKWVLFSADDSQGMAILGAVARGKGSQRSGFSVADFFGLETSQYRDNKMY
jgi:hypothetical protein